MRDSLAEHAGHLVAAGRVDAVRRVVEASRFHLAVMDVRDHSRTFHQLVSELFELNDLVYPDDEPGRRRVLDRELAGRRPLSAA